MTHQPVFPNAPFKSHMPFFDGQTLLFCQAGDPLQRSFECTGTIWRAIADNPRLRERFAGLPRQSTVRYRAWKLAWCNWNDRRPHRIVTGLPMDAVECSPAFYRDGATVHLSFIGGVPDANRFVYHLYEMTGPALDRLGPAIPVSDEPTRIGFVSPRHICTGRGRGVTLTGREDGQQLTLECPMDRVLRVAFSAGCASDLLISGVGSRRREVTLLYRPDSGDAYEVWAASSAYKATLSGDRIVHAVRSSGGLEDIQLHHGAYSLRPAPRIERRQTAQSVAAPRP